MKESTINSLYNFKKKKEYFLESLKEFRFTPRYHGEYVLLDNKSKRPVSDIIIPMVCWCDIPLERIHNHTVNYGKYGIGVSKEWAIKNLINPIIYVIEDTDISSAFSQIKDLHIDLIELMNNDLVLKNKIAHITGPLFYANHRVIQHLKPYSYQNNPSKQKNRKFYDEKEWRYVPDPIHPLESLTIFPSRYKNDKQLQDAIDLANEKIKDRYLYFEPDHVQIIIIEQEDDRQEVINCIKETCESKGFKDKFEVLVDKIKTIDEIKH